jgi:type II secretory pathway component PulK
MNNMFSVSKSGEKLIRVVRSVQELASELDETSRTVTGGDYSFFEQIKDQRDRDTVLSLATGRPTYGGDAAAEDNAASSAPLDDVAETDDTSAAVEDGESRPG